MLEYFPVDQWSVLKLRTQKKKPKILVIKAFYFYFTSTGDEETKVSKSLSGKGGW